MWRIRGDIPRAVAAQAQALKLAPNSPTVVRVYLLGLLSAEQYDKVLSVSQPYANKEGFVSLVAAISARALVKLNKPAEAEKLFTAALQRARPGEMNLVVQQIRETYGLEDAIKKLSGWLPVRPKSRDIHLLLGDLHVQANQAQEGIKMYVKAFELADKPVQKAETRVRMGLVYHKYGKFPEAEKSYLAALKIIPNHSATLNNLAYLYVSQLNQPAKALQYAERAFKRKPNDRNILDTYGWVLAALGQYNKAERFLNRSLQMGEAMAPNLYHLGWVHEKTGRVTQAALRYQQALKLLADSKDAQLQKAVKEALERIKKPAAEGSGSK
jgi:tetratricopeptide (TPR) repeat protein